MKIIKTPELVPFSELKLGQHFMYTFGTEHLGVVIGSSSNTDMDYNYFNYFNLTDSELDYIDIEELVKPVTVIAIEVGR